MPTSAKDSPDSDATRRADGVDGSAAEERSRDIFEGDGFTRRAEPSGQTEVLVQQIIATSPDNIQALTFEGNLLPEDSAGQCLQGVAQREHLPGDSWLESWEEKDRASARIAISTASKEGSGRFVGTTRTKDGRVIWWDTVVARLPGGGGQHEHLLAISRDVTESKLAEIALAEKEQHLRLLMESIKDHAIFTLDQNGVITSWNAAAERIFGYTAEEIIGKDFDHLWIVADSEKGLPAVEMAEAEEKGTAEDERWHRRKDGTHFFASGALSAVYGLEGTASGYTKVCRDLTRRRREANEISSVRTRLDAALIAGELGTWVWEIETDRVYADKNMAHFFSLTEGEAAGAPVARFLEAIHPDDVSRVQAAVDQSIKSGSEFGVDYRVRSHNGLRWLIARGRIEKNEKGEPVRLPGVVLDITERKRAEAELQTIQERFGLTIEAAQLGTFYCPMPLGEIVWNDKCKEHFWLPPEAKITFDRFYSILHPEDRERTRTAIEAALFDKVAYDIEYRTVSPDGQIRWIRAMGHCFYDSEGEPIRFDGITVDISESKRLEKLSGEALAAERAARSEAERASRLKDDFLATLSHELRTPLNAILGWTQVLRSSRRSEEDIDQGLDTIERNARAQTQIIEDLLEMSRIISGKIRLDVQSLNLGSVVDAAIETMRPAAEVKGIRIQAILDPLARPMTGDPNRLQQVFWNLLSNAIKFTPRDGKVQIVLQRVNSHIEVSVVDTGEGIAAEFLPHVFDRFRQADGSTTRQHGGLGLGLAIVRQLVELHGGTVAVKSAGVGQGSTFIVVLPLIDLHDDDAPPKLRGHSGEQCAPLESLITSLRLDGLKAVVVDDEPEARALVARLLSDCGGSVFVAANAAQALAMVEKEKPDVLVSDIGMPGEDGYSLIKRVRELGADRGGKTPAIALTAYARSEDRMKAVLAGFQMHISKPVEGAELIAMIASATGRTRSQT